MHFTTISLNLILGLGLTASPQQRPHETAPREAHVDAYHGVRVPDPYRWMEELEAPRTRRWVEHEDARARELAAELPRREAVREEVDRLADVRRYRPQWKRGDRYFYLTYQSSGGTGTPGTQLHVREGGKGPERTLIAQDDLSAGTTLTRIVPGPEGRLVAYGVASVGSRWETLRVLDVERRLDPERFASKATGR